MNPQQMKLKNLIINHDRWMVGRIGIGIHGMLDGRSDAGGAVPHADVAELLETRSQDGHKIRVVGGAICM